MAQFLTTSGTSYYIEQLIVNATSTLTLVTPYLQLSQNFIERLQDADESEIQITIIYGKDHLKQKEWRILNNLNHTTVHYCPNLHAKCYFNEDKMIISSMNLYEYSEKNNREMSIQLDRKVDKDIFENALYEIESIKNASTLEKSSKKNRSSKTLDDYDINKDNLELYNFHIPYLYHLLQKEFPDFDFQIENHDSYKQMIAEDFPIDGMRMKITRRIDLDFEERHMDLMLYEKKEDIKKTVPARLFYFNKRDIKIYGDKNWEVNMSNLISKGESFLKIIKKLANIIRSM